jgi:hypothetical protein
MASRIVLGGQTAWADQEFRRLTNNRRVLRRPVDVRVAPYIGQNEFGEMVEKNTISTRVPHELPVRVVRNPVGFDENGRAIVEKSLEMSDCAEPPPRAYEPYQEGVAVLDPDENVVYRRIQSQDPKEGWATTAFYQDFWGCDHETILKLARRGLVDASMRAGSQIRRYRCRDNRLVLESGLVGAKGRNRDEDTSSAHLPSAGTRGRRRTGG